ncbi:hypothetical protein ACSTJN_23675, partial [Vibrio parahaemolyticus]
GPSAPGTSGAALGSMAEWTPTRGVGVVDGGGIGNGAGLAGSDRGVSVRSGWRVDPDSHGASWRVEANV